MRTAELVTTDKAKLITGDILQLPCTVNYYYIRNNEQCKEAVEEILASITQEENIIAVDLETTGLDPYLDDILLLQVGLNNNVQYIFDARKISPEIVLPIFSANCWKAGHNIKFDAKFIKQKWKANLTKLYDTMLAEKLIRGGDFFGGGYSLDVVLERRLGRELKIITSDFKSDAKEKAETAKKHMQKSFMNLKSSTQELTPAQLAYAAQDVSAGTIHALACWQIEELNKLQPNTIHNSEIGSFIRDKELIKEYSKMYPTSLSLWPTALLEFQFVEVLIDLELNGIGFCKETHSKVMANLHSDYNSYREEFLKVIGEGAVQETLFGTASINPDSNKQVLISLKEIGLELEDTGADTLENALLGLKVGSKQYKVIKALLGYRSASKLVQSFGVKLYNHIHPTTNRIHYGVQQVLATGRISTANPNIQQIPGSVDWRVTEDEEHKKEVAGRVGFRECFVPDKGYKYIIYDYSSQELRVAASISMDALMLQGFRENKDPHCFSATLMYNEDYDNFIRLLKSGDKASKRKRQEAKLVSFGSLYGSGPSNLANKLHTTLDEAKKILNRYWSSYPDLAQAMPRYNKLANKLYYSNTVLGRRRYYTDLAQKIKYIQLEQSPNVIDKKVRDLKMFWLLEDGPITYDTMEDAKKRIIYKYRSKIGRDAGNHHIQGTSADMMKLAAITIRRDIINNNLDAKIVGLIHDEIIVEVKDDILDKCEGIIITRMEESMNAFCPNVPAKVDGQISDMWPSKE